MKEKILAFLVARLAGIQKAYLEGVAENFSKTITEETQIEITLNEGVLSTLKHSAELIQKEGDRRATEATQTAITNYEQKHNLKDGKVVNQNPPPGGVTPPNPPTNGDDETKALLKQLLESNNSLKSEMETLKQEKTLQTKQQQALTSIKESKIIPDKFKEKWASRINVDSETSIADQVKELETEYTELHTSIVGANSGKGLPTGSSVKGEVSEEEAQEIVDKL